MITTSTQNRSADSVRNPVSSVASRVADVAGDFMELAELQANLTKFDVENLVTSVRPAVIGVFVGSTMILPALTLILFSASHGISELFGLGQWVSQFIVGATFLLLAMVIVGLSFRRMKSAMTNLNSSMNQLQENIAWLKGVFRG